MRLGQVVHYGGRSLEYRGRARDRDRHHVFQGHDGVPLSLTDRELLAAQQRGELRLVNGDVDGNDAPRAASMDTATDADREQQRRRFAYVRGWVLAGRPPREPDALGPLVAAVAEELDDAARPSTRTVARWLKAWLEAGENAEALLPQRGGNRSDRLGVGARDLLRDTVERHYLVDTRPSGVAVHRAVRAAFEAHNRILPPTERLPVPSLQAVYGQVKSIDRYTLDFCREGPRAAALRWRPLGDGPMVERHNQAWEYDHTQVDAIVMDEVSGLPIGRPWVTVAIDRYSRCVMGLRIGFEAPSAQSVLDCMRAGVSPKEDLLQAFPDVRGSWPCYGVPEVAVTDNGREFKSRAFLDACLSLGVDVEYTPVLKAWYKGRVERFFRTLSREVFHRVPGTTFSNIFERSREAIPETVAHTTLHELRTLTLRWVVDSYHHKPHRALGGRSPMAVWTESVQRGGIALPPPPDELATLTALVVWRKPQRYGIEFEGLLYNSADVARFRVRNNRVASVKVRVDPQDLTRVWFADPFDGQVHEVPVQPSARARMAGVTLEKHRVARAMQLQNPERLAGEAGLFAAHNLLEEALHLRAGQDGVENRQRAGNRWAALLLPQPIEDAPMFDTVASAGSLVDQVLGPPGEFTAPERQPRDTRPEQEPREEVPLAASDAPRAARPPARPAPVVRAPADDLDDLVARMGLRLADDGQEGQQ